MYRQIFFLFVYHSQITQMRPAPCRYSWLTESLCRQCLDWLTRSIGQGAQVEAHEHRLLQLLVSTTKSVDRH
ncbi:hypothetical protein T4B_9697 [Trichinella pseudospiralis]|uniref:Uncharacterized protein n=1 Tax=Trichinella pseudospiralis TaxID=6337 RepID=A0A0V1IPS1_TRIPS|nr:hypothetical protein T4A_7347 [Trichinella pseudospiralis]KRZ04253.1 hypothetical protein T4B_9697 [Trichinella pseudospiralis]KRZ24814.1 hypothetical protein T4C_4043 [Trichinella pseudospiralis]